MNPISPDRLLPPVAVVLGSPRQTAALVAGLAEVTCYQMDLYQAGRLRDELSRHPDEATIGPDREGEAAAEPEEWNHPEKRHKSRDSADPARREPRPPSQTANPAQPARVVTAADLWDLPAEFRTVFYPAPKAGERSLKIDMVEQAFHILKPGGRLYVHSPYARDDLFADLLKKVFGKAHVEAGKDEMVIWARRDGDRPRRRHELAFHARIGNMNPLRFLSRPGTFSYGKFDLGARALVETMRIDPGERVLDLGCGCGTNGIVAGRRSGPKGHVVFVDSNLRAVVLAEINARSAELPRFEVRAAIDAGGLEPESFDVVLANPPYYAEGEIARRFIEQARGLLRPGGRMYLVTKQVATILEMVAEHFDVVEGTEARGYDVLEGRC